MSSNIYGTVETLYEWMDALNRSCCCIINYVGRPQLFTETTGGSGSVGYATINQSGEYYGKRTVTYKDENDNTLGKGTSTLKNGTHRTMLYNGDIISDYKIEEKPFTGPFSATGGGSTAEVSYSDPIDVEGVKQEIYSAIRGAANFNQPGSEGVASTIITGLSVSVANMRFRFWIPDLFSGNFVKITCDILERREGKTNSSVVQSGLTFVWRNVTRYTETYEVSPPPLSQPGVRFVGNVRFQIFEDDSRYGNPIQPLNS